MYFITTKRMLEVCFFQHTPTFIIEPELRNTGMAGRLLFRFFCWFESGKERLSQLGGSTRRSASGSWCCRFPGGSSMLAEKC